MPRYRRDTDDPIASVESAEGSTGGFSKKLYKWEVVQQINTQGEPNKARYMPHNPDIIASMGPDGILHIFDRTKHPSMPKEDDTSVNPQLVLAGHKGDSFALAWCPKDEGKGLLAAGGEDGVVRLWNVVTGFEKGMTTMNPLREINQHSAIVNDVSFSPYLFCLATCSDDKTAAIHDWREGKDSSYSVVASTDAVNCVAWGGHPGLQWNLFTGHGSSDPTIALWNITNFRKEGKLHVFKGHNASVLKIQFPQGSGNFFASSSEDRRINIWSLKDIGAEQEPEEAEDGPPEL